MAPLGRRVRGLALALLSALVGAPAGAVDLAWSTFGTIGWAQSNRGFAYERVDRGGTLRRDTLLAAQVDAQLAPHWSATVQARLAPAERQESGWDLRAHWAFVAWRPDNRWLLRAGRLRVPLYLYSESVDIGQSHELLRLPAEVYSLSRTTDLDGAAAAYEWALGANDLSAELFHGRVPMNERRWYRDGLPGVVPAGAHHDRFDIRITGLALTARSAASVLRLGLHQAQVRGASPFPVRYPQVSPAPGLAYYQVEDLLPGPGVPRVDHAGMAIFSLGGEHRFGEGWRLSAEVARSRQRHTEVGPESEGGYVALSRRLGRLTPYVSVGKLRAGGITLDWYRRLMGSALPDAVPGAATVNALQRMAAEALRLSNQRTTALGCAIALDEGLKLKAEWARTRIGAATRLADTPPGQDSPSGTAVEMLSLGLSFAY